jgi:uncharacterized membrane protein YebE (DUF533 family)
MHEQDIAIVKALVPMAWADGEFAEQERETIDALLDAFNATAAEKEAIKEYAKTRRTLDDIEAKAAMEAASARAKKFLHLL